MFSVAELTAYSGTYVCQNLWEGVSPPIPLASEILCVWTELSKYWPVSEETAQFARHTFARAWLDLKKNPPHTLYLNWANTGQFQSKLLNFFHRRANYLFLGCRHFPLLSKLPIFVGCRANGVFLLLCGVKTHLCSVTGIDIDDRSLSSTGELGRKSLPEW